MPITETPVNFFGHQFITRKILATFMDFFAKRIYVERYDEAGDILKYIRPPIHFSNRQRFIALTTGSNQSDNFNTSPNVLDLNYILPRMSVSITGMSYASNKHLTKFQKLRACDYDGDAATLSSVLTPVPYVLSLDLSILTKSIDDTFQIIEQIIPYFGPSLSFDMNVLSGFAPESVSYTLTSVTPDSNDEYGVVDDRVFLSTLSFETYANYYYIKRTSGIIREIIANFYVQKDDDYAKIKSYELNADNLAPITTVATREDEPITTTITEYEE